MSAWRGAWGDSWADAWGPLGPEVVHPLGAVTLALHGALVPIADPQIVTDVADDELIGTGGPDDETLDPRARKWLRERYKKQPAEQTQVARGVSGLHKPVKDGSTPSPATTIEPLPVFDVAPLKEDLAAAAQEAIAVVNKARMRDEDNRRRAIALVLALMDD